MSGAEDDVNISAVAKVMHELNAARLELRNTSSELNRATSAGGKKLDIEKLRGFGIRVVEQLDNLDVLFEFLRIELNPKGIGYVPKTDQSIHGLYYRAISHFAHRMKAKGLKWQMTRDLGFVVNAYPSLAIVPMVLIDNAVKYSPRGGTIYINLEKEQRRAFVESAGPKISEAEMAGIFMEGVRGDFAKLAQPGGQGLGLFIAKQILEVHGYSISASQSGGFLLEGIPYASTEFTVTFETRSGTVGNASAT